MSDILAKRRQVKEAYGNSDRWSKKVDGMTDEQIVAIFFRLKKQNKI